jgi:hypothetical protein
MSKLVITEVHGKVGLIRINRPEALNALNNEVVDGIGAAIDGFEADENIGCIVLTGNEKAFAAGADIGFMKDFDYMHAYKTDFITRNWERIKTTRKPVIAACGGLCPGRWLRDGDDVRHDLCCRHGEVRPAGDPPGHHARRRRHPAPAPRGGQGQGHGPVPHRPHDGCRRGREGRAGGPHHPRRAVAGRDPQGRGHHRRASLCRWS